MRTIIYIWPGVSCYQFVHFKGVEDPLSSEGTILFSSSATCQEQPLAVVGILNKSSPYVQCPFPLKRVLEQSQIRETSFALSSPVETDNSCMYAAKIPTSKRRKPIILSTSQVHPTCIQKCLSFSLCPSVFSYPTSSILQLRKVQHPL